ncbi:MAG: hypothetical protein ACE5QW_07075 [Thermoplasmata archaeon]
MKRKEKKVQSMRMSPLDSVRPLGTKARNILLLVTDYQIYQDFAEWVIMSVKAEGQPILHVMFDDRISPIIEGSEGILEVLDIAHVCGCENEIEMTKKTLDALSRMEGYHRIFFDPLSPFSQLFSEDSAPVHILKELAPFLERRKTLAYFCMAMDSHKNDTIAQSKDVVDVCLQVTRQDEAILVQPIKARGIYTRDFFLPRVYKSWPITEKAKLVSAFNHTMKQL